MIRRWKISTRTTRGTVTITDAAMMCPRNLELAAARKQGDRDGTVRCVFDDVMSARRGTRSMPQ